jgi:IstB-like ATP binding protein
MATTPKTSPVLSDPISGDLKAILRALKLGRMLDTLPERLTLARQQHLAHADFLELVLAEEVSRRDTNSAALRARAAGLDPGMRLDSWDTTAAVRFDQQLWNELTSLRFLDGPHGALILGPVGVGKTHLASALGHIAVRRRHSVHMSRADKLFKRLKAARLDNSTDGDPRQIAAALIAVGVTKPRNETPPPSSTTTRCPHCAKPLPTPAATGRPNRWCSPACRQAAHRQRTVVTKPRNETPCPTCGRPISTAATGRPARSCSPACRTRAWRTHPYNR